MNKKTKAVGNEKIVREDGYLYYIGKDGYVWKTPESTNLRGKKSRVGTEKIKRENGYLYFLGSDGRVWASKIRMIKK